MDIPLSIYIGICIATLVVWLLAILSSVSMRRLGCLVGKARTTPVTSEKFPPITIVIKSHNQMAELRRNLPMYLNQYYPCYEVIVVDMASTDDTKKLLETLEGEHQILRHTFTPSTSRDVSQTRLAITLGMKAAAHPWVLITDADCAPLSHSWLSHMANALCHHRSAKIVVGYVKYKYQGWGSRKLQHYNLWQQMISLPHVIKHGAIRSGGENYIYNRDLFLEHQGFASNQTLMTGASDILINNHSTKDNTEICVHHEAVLSKPLPRERHMWRQERLFYQETRKHFRHTVFYGLKYFFHSTIHLLNHILLLSTIAIGLMNADNEPHYFIMVSTALALGIIHFIVLGYCFNYTARMIEDRKQNYFITNWYIARTPLWDAISWLQHKFTREKYFRKKFI